MVQLACKPVEVVAVRTASPAFCAVTITSVLLYPFCTLTASLLELKETVPISAFAGATDSLMFCGCPTVRLSLLCAKTMLGLFSSAPEAVNSYFAGCTVFSIRGSYCDFCTSCIDTFNLCFCFITRYMNNTVIAALPVRLACALSGWRVAVNVLAFFWFQADRRGIQCNTSQFLSTAFYRNGNVIYITAVICTAVI